MLITCTEASGDGFVMWTAGATAWAVFLARIFFDGGSPEQLSIFLLQLQQLSAAFSAPLLRILEPIWPAPLHQLRSLQLPPRVRRVPSARTAATIIVACLSLLAARVLTRLRNLERAAQTSTLRPFE